MWQSDSLLWQLRLGRLYLKAVWLPLCLLLIGCAPPNTAYDFGLGTTEVAGVVDLGGADPSESDAIVVVLKNHYTFITTGSGSVLSGDTHPEFRSSITRPTAHIQRIDQSGSYLIDLPADVVSVDVLFLASNYLSKRMHFARSVGIGRINFRAVLPLIPDWRNHFYTYIQPQLQELIVDARYRMAEREQKLLGDWLAARKQTLEAKRR
ncbi:MAG: hypothetical protein O7B79_07120 [SAR324 cluster bacterium]|nr:hypothetical protein [SAR324 cluster bacterium]